MKSTYSVAITATIYYDKAEWLVRFTFPAAVDCDAINNFIEDIESRPSLPSEDEMLTILGDYYFDDEPDIKKARHYKISRKEYLRIVHEAFEDDDALFYEASQSVQQSFCRNCGAEGDSVEPDAINYTCPSCEQDALQSVAAALGII